MTGAGTQEDPYIVDNWPDLNTAMTISNSTYVELSPNTVIDLNESVPEGFTSRIDWLGHLDGKGGTIRNLATTAGKIFGTNGIEFKNLNFLNFRGSGGICERINTNSSLTLYNCKFSGRLDNAGTLFMVYQISIRRCSFNIRCFGTGSITFSWWDRDDGMPLEYNRIEIHSSTNSGFQTADVANSYFTGEFAGAITAKGSTNVIDCTCSQITSSSSGTYILVNSDKCTNIASQSVIPVTEAQMIDAEYLESLGFPIQT